jgi:hypothetical protein
MYSYDISPAVLIYIRTARKACPSLLEHIRLLPSGAGKTGGNFLPSDRYSQSLAVFYDDPA